MAVWYHSMVLFECKLLVILDSQNVTKRTVAMVSASYSMDFMLLFMTVFWRWDSVAHVVSILGRYHSLIANERKVNCQLTTKVRKDQHGNASGNAVIRSQQLKNTALHDYWREQNSQKTPSNSSSCYNCSSSSHRQSCTKTGNIVNCFVQSDHPSTEALSEFRGKRIDTRVRHQASKQNCRTLHGAKSIRKRLQVPGTGKNSSGQIGSVVVTSGKALTTRDVRTKLEHSGKS